MSIQEQVADAWNRCLQQYAACLAYDRFEKDPSAISQMGHTSLGFLHGISHNISPNSKNKISWYRPPAPPKGHQHLYVVEGYDDPLEIDRQLFRVTGKDVSELGYGPFDAPSWRRTSVQKSSHQLYPLALSSLPSP